jgi:hypothetical protein
MVDIDDSLKKALYKKAVGYSEDEITEEWGNDENGKLVLLKKKITKKVYPPDDSAVKTYLDSYSDKKDYESFSDEELIKEQKKLLNELKSDKK